MFNFCHQVASNFKSQRGNHSFEHAVVESLSIVICYHNNYSSNCVFPYFPIERVDASCQSLATYLMTDSLQFGRLCKLEVCAAEKSCRRQFFFWFLATTESIYQCRCCRHRFTSVAFKNYENYFCKFWEVCKFRKSGKFGEICRAYLRDIFHKILRNTHTRALHLTHTLSHSHFSKI